jgi:hypothetical protein
MIQCKNHSSQDIRSACRCVTVKVIKPVAVNEVNNCSNNACIVYIAEILVDLENSEREAQRGFLQAAKQRRAQKR